MKSNAYSISCSLLELSVVEPGPVPPDSGVSFHRSSQSPETHCCGILAPEHASKGKHGMETLQAGDPPSIGAFKLFGRLGIGGMGIVYAAVAPNGDHAAVKIIRPELAHDPSFRARFRREAASLQQVGGLCTAKVLAADPDGAQPYLATEYVAGPTLDEYVQSQGPMRRGPLHALALGLAEALTAIHGAGLAHRDLKPSNVILSQTGPKVIDFGIARAADATSITSTGLVVGTPAWLAPEQLSGDEQGVAVDIFTWGLVVAYAATGRSPFGEGPAEALMYRLAHTEPDLQDVPDSLRNHVHAALRKEPAARPTAQSLLRGLVEGSDAPAGTAVTALMARDWKPPLAKVSRPSKRTTRQPRRPGRSARSIAMAVVVLLVAGVAAFVVPGPWHSLLPGGQPENPITEFVVYNPFTGGEPSKDIRIVETLQGIDCMDSGGSDRREAYRCGIGTDTRLWADPCFLPASWADADVMICPEDIERKTAIQINAPDLSLASETREEPKDLHATLPFQLELVDGRICAMRPGPSRLVGDLRENYDCDKEGFLTVGDPNRATAFAYGDPDRATRTWRIMVQSEGESDMQAVAISRVWY
jgi:serine/threonine protein kinase